MNCLCFLFCTGVLKNVALPFRTIEKNALVDRRPYGCTVFKKKKKLTLQYFFSAKYIYIYIYIYIYKNRNFQQLIQIAQTRHNHSRMSEVILLGR